MRFCSFGCSVVPFLLFPAVFRCPIVLLALPWFPHLTDIEPQCTKFLFTYNVRKDASLDLAPLMTAVQAHQFCATCNQIAAMQQRVTPLSDHLLVLVAQQAERAVAM